MNAPIDLPRHALEQDYEHHNASRIPSFQSVLDT